MKEALGLLEVSGLLGAITAADAMVKSANVRILGIERAKGFGWMTVKVAGDVGAVQAAVQTGVAVVKDMNLFVTERVIPRPVDEIETIFVGSYKDEGHKTKKNENPIHTVMANGLDEKSVEVMEEIVAKIVDPKPSTAKKKPSKKTTKK